MSVLIKTDRGYKPSPRRILDTNLGKNKQKKERKKEIESKMVSKAVSLEPTVSLGISTNVNMHRMAAFLLPSESLSLADTKSGNLTGSVRFLASKNLL